MSNYRGHVAGAALFSVAYLAILTLVFNLEIIPTDREIFSGFAFPIVLVGLSVMFGLFPDVDINSHAQNIFYSMFFVVDIWLIATKNFEEAAYLGLIAMLPVISKHRGWTHKKISMVLIPMPLLLMPAANNPDDIWVGLPYYGAAVVGYFSHLWFDRLILKKWRRR
ncbi:MAG: metal-dependent hydrolase [Candidatus Saccharimonadales bacterium]|nr:metal-dependent hydrolase [Candidatus Saccharimonadales bacterium]